MKFSWMIKISILILSMSVKKKYDSSEKLIDHHIKPVHDGGQDDPENLVKLSYQDHVEAHCLVAVVYPSVTNKINYNLMNGMEKSVYHAVRILGAEATHQLLKSRKKNFWDLAFQKKMLD